MAHSCPDVLVVYFDKGNPDDVSVGYKEDTVPLPDPASGEYLGHKLWKEYHHSWAIDYITCDDERWISFGPYLDRDDIDKAVADIQSKVKHCFLGYRIINAHCMEHKKGLQHKGMWKDA